MKPPIPPRANSPRNNGPPASITIHVVPSSYRGRDARYFVKYSIWSLQSPLIVPYAQTLSRVTQRPTPPRVTLPLLGNFKPAQPTLRWKCEANPSANQPTRLSASTIVISSIHHKHPSHSHPSNPTSSPSTSSLSYQAS